MSFLPRDFELPVGAFALKVPIGATVPDLFWEHALLCAAMQRDGFDVVAREQLERLQGWLKEPHHELDPPPIWYVLRVTPRQERFVQQALTDNGLVAYYPLHITEARHAKRQAKRTGPLIPGYLFACLPDDHAIFLALGLRPVIELMSRDGKPRTVRSIDVGSLVFFEACHAFDETWVPPPVKGRRYSHRWKAGERVRIDRGAFEGHVGQVIKGRGRNQMEVLLSLFGRHFEAVVQHKDLVRAT